MKTDLHEITSKAYDEVVLSGYIKVMDNAFDGAGKETIRLFKAMRAALSHHMDMLALDALNPIQFTVARSLEATRNSLLHTFNDRDSSLTPEQARLVVEAFEEKFTAAVLKAAGRGIG